MTCEDGVVQNIIRFTDKTRGRIYNIKGPQDPDKFRY